MGDRWFNMIKILDLIFNIDKSKIIKLMLFWIVFGYKFYVNSYNSYYVKFVIAFGLAIDYLEYYCFKGKWEKIFFYNGLVRRKGKVFVFWYF